MTPIKIMINGMPGNVAVIIAKHAINDKRFDLLKCSLTGPEITEKTIQIDRIDFELIKHSEHEKKIESLVKSEGSFICIDYTHPSAINQNAELYCKYNIPFVMGTTGGDRQKLMNTVFQSNISAVIAPNMVKQIIGLQAMMAYASENFPDLFKDYTLKVTESHQQGKADTSGTAREMVKYFNKMGVDFQPEQIEMIRNPIVQKQMGVPEAYIKGHGWHTYTLASKDNTILLEFKHNVCGRDIYCQGTFDAVVYLHEKIRQKIYGKVFNMIDVMKRN